MKFLKILGGIVFILGLIGLAGSIIVPARLSSQAQLIQRMTPYDADIAALTGDVGTPIGEPQQMIITDQAAFLPGKLDSGARQVNDNYLKEKGIYPLQVKTVNYVAGLVRLAAASALVVGLIAFLWANSRLKRKTTTENLTPVNPKPAK